MNNNLQSITDEDGMKDIPKISKFKTICHKRNEAIIWQLFSRFVINKIRKQSFAKFDFDLDWRVQCGLANFEDIATDANKMKQ